MIYRSQAMTGLGLQTSLECSCVYTPGTSSYARKYTPSGRFDLYTSRL